MNARLNPDSIAEDVLTALSGVEKTPGPAKLRYTHDAMIDQIIMNPAVSQNQLAEIFGYTPGWVSLVVNTAMFKARLAARKEQLVDPTIVASLEEEFTAVTRRSLYVLREKLAADPSKIPDQLALRAAELGAKALGIGGNAPPTPLADDHLDRLAGRLTNLLSNARKGTVYEELQVVQDVSPRDVSSPVGRGGVEEGPGAHAGEGGAAQSPDGGGRQG